MSQALPRDLTDELVATLDLGRLPFGPRAILAWLRALPTQPLRPDRAWYELTCFGQMRRL